MNRLVFTDAFRPMHSSIMSLRAKRRSITRSALFATFGHDALACPNRDSLKSGFRQERADASRPPGTAAKTTFALAGPE